MPLFRRAKPAPVSWNIAKTVVQVAAFWGFFLFWLPPRLVSWTAPFAPPVVMASSRGVAAALFLVGSLLGLWSAWTMVVQGQGTPLPLDATRELVVSGPYRWVRNPMAVAGVVQGIAVSLWLGSFMVLAFFLIGAATWHVFVRPIEERDLMETFGAAYTAYQRSTGLWWPRRRA